ncbi:MAG TPA: hypothetical protein VFL08_05265, partial [Arthrobacter sp.]|nr:hypothetical protein [Arthrobacter sp.]
MNLRGKARAKGAVSAPAFRHRLFRSRLFGSTAFGLALIVLVVGAVLYPGFKTTEVELNDGGVWVVSKSKNAVGRLNYPSRVLDGAVTPAST